jgi:hypothetical protein
MLYLLAISSHKVNTGFGNYCASIYGADVKYYVYEETAVLDYNTEPTVSATTHVW